MALVHSSDAIDPFPPKHYPEKAFADTVVVDKMPNGDLKLRVKLDAEVTIPAECLADPDMNAGELADLFEQRLALDWWEVRRVIARKVAQV